MKQFRGLTKGGRWVYGWYKEDTYGKPKILAEDQITHFLCWFFVIPKTVGQSTGLKDKNGKGTNEAYEDDIVIISCKSGPKHRFKGVIKYSAPEFYVACFWDDDGEQCCWYPVGENNRSLIQGIWSIDEIIGNIHQNPELLEKE